MPQRPLRHRNFSFSWVSNKIHKFDMKRRNFIKGTGAAVAGTLLAHSGVMSAAASCMLADKINIGVIGCNGMGWSNVASLLKMNDVDLVAICDVDDNVVQKRVDDYKKLRNNKPKTYKDYRELLNDRDVDAVVIGTPDHWHCRMMVDAVNAGKHVYVEKPIANSIEECRIMVEAQERTGKVVQAGQWQRSCPHYRKAFEIVRSGVLGRIRLLIVWADQGWMKPVPVVHDSKQPAGVDYKFWLGPAPER